MGLTPSQRRALNWAVLAAVAVALLWALGPVLTPFVIGAVLAYALHPAVESLAARRVPRLVAVILVEVATLFALAALVLLIVPILSKELPLLNEQLPLLVERINRAVSPWLVKMGIPVSLDPANLREFLIKYLNANWDEGLAAALSSARIGGSIIVTVVGYVILVPVVLFYLLVDWPFYVLRAIALVPPRLRASVASFTHDCDVVLGQYLRGQLLVMLLMAAFYSVGLALFGFELAVPVGVFTGLAIFVPYVGFGIGMILALLAGALQFTGWYGPIAVFVVYGIGQIVEGLFLTPKMVGQRIGMSTLTVIFALFAFGHLFGFVGVLIALPASALIAVATARLRTGYTQSSLYTG
ncbi:MAG TPA: AI-2E family transporter [Caldimonas sp.]|jgi:predicted PurR-regulated permease PerM|nr:AI-2E family transporter [Caldimonas sp.]